MGGNANRINSWIPCRGHHRQPPVPLAPPDSLRLRSRRKARAGKRARAGCRARVGIDEPLVLDDELPDALQRGAGEFRRLAGMRTLRDDGLRQVRAGVTTLEEILRVTRSEGSRLPTRP